MPNYQPLINGSTGICRCSHHPCSCRLPGARSVEAHTTFMPFFFFFLPSPSWLGQLNFCLKILHAYSLRLCIQQSAFSFAIGRSKHSLQMKWWVSARPAAALELSSPFPTPTPRVLQVRDGQSRKPLTRCQRVPPQGRGLAKRQFHSHWGLSAFGWSQPCSGGLVAGWWGCRYGSNPHHS